MVGRDAPEPSPRLRKESCGRVRASEPVDLRRHPHGLNRELSQERGDDCGLGSPVTTALQGSTDCPVLLEPTQPTAAMLGCGQARGASPTFSTLTLADRVSKPSEFPGKRCDADRVGIVQTTCPRDGQDGRFGIRHGEPRTLG